MIELTSLPIDSQRVLNAVASTSAGAIVLFLGTVREITGDRRTTALDYECYPAMAEKLLTELKTEACGRWSLVDVAIVHRLGHLEPGETSVAVAVSSAHRQAAFEAGQWIIDTLKARVPIWKKENWADGTTEWVHPGTTTPC